MNLLIIAAAVATAAPPVVPVAPPPIRTVPVEADDPVSLGAFVPFMQALIRPIPESGRYSLDFTVDADGAVHGCRFRALDGDRARVGAVPMRCPKPRFEPYKDANGVPVQRNVSYITSVTVADVK